ncbi:hypothetical protein VTO42DRAFT_1898 [Malbranchea cinnamomea]
MRFIPLICGLLFSAAFVVAAPVEANAVHDTEVETKNSTATVPTGGYSVEFPRTGMQRNFVQSWRYQLSMQHRQGR